MRAWPGNPLPLGATFDGVGTNIAIFSDVADAVELCVFDDDGNETRVELPERSGSVWHGYFPDLGAGTPVRLPRPRPVGSRATATAATRPSCCSTRTRAPIEGTSSGGSRCSATTSTIDWRWTPPTPRRRCRAASSSTRSSTGRPTSRCCCRGPTRSSTRRTSRARHELHPDIDEELRGTYAGIAHPAFIDHLKSLGVTTLELLPVHQFVHDAHLVERGLRNYWGYNSIGFFAPHNEYSHRHGQGAAGAGLQADGARRCTRPASR